MEKLSEEKLKKIGELFRNPPLGSKIAAAKEFGIDLTLTFEQLKKLRNSELITFENFLTKARKFFILCFLKIQKRGGRNGD